MRARKLAAGPTLAYGRTKRLIDRSFDHDLSDQIEAEQSSFVASTGTADFREGVDAFVAKRKPDFKGE